MGNGGDQVLPVEAISPWTDAGMGNPRIRLRIASAFARVLPALLLAMIGAAQAEPVPAASTSATEPADRASYFMTTSQLSDPLKPFAHLPKNADIEVHAAVVTVPDPTETRLGRAFDVELGAVVSAFQASGYVLDGFAFDWKPKTPGSDGEYPASTGSARRSPSVLLFRRDNWRECHKDDPVPAFCGSSYYVLFLVGETPTSGIHRDAFKLAASCAMVLDSTNRGNAKLLPSDIADLSCDSLAKDREKAPMPLDCDRRLEVIGPSFSGAMESMAAALNEAATEAATMPCGGRPANEASGQLQVRLLTPSASVSDNENVLNHVYLKPANTGRFKVKLDYRSLAYSVSRQMDQVVAYLEPRMSPGSSVVVFSEESSFGGGAVDDFIKRRVGHGNMICKEGATDNLPACWGRVVAVQFPPNIAAIRAEHVRIRQKDDEQVRQVLPERLLELDLTGVDKGADQPPTYQPSLGSRSDELMLYQTFDALKKSIRPAAAIIVATDVRDRLFLLSQIHDVLPGVLPVVLEQDNLLEHPDYRDISRGSITMPAGRSLVCLNSYNDPIPCPQSESAPGASATQKAASKRDLFKYPEFPRRFAFATDYAANIFRAMVWLAKPQDVQDQRGKAYAAFGEEQLSPHMLVATLAGFQDLDNASSAPASASSSEAPPEENQDILIVADTRIQLQGPVYLAMALVFAGMLVAVLWLIRHGSEQALLAFPLHRYALRWSSVVCEATSLRFSKVSVAWWLVWVVMAVTGLEIAGGEVLRTLFFRRYDDVDLAHGRALCVLVGLCLAYGCFIVITLLRVREWDAHCKALSDAVGDQTPLGMRLRRHGGKYAALSALLALVALRMSITDANPVSANCAWVSELAAAFAICGSAYFLALFAEAFDRLCRISMELDGAVALIQRGTGMGDWPTPRRLGERPVSPFNIAMRLKNYQVWHQYGCATWAAYVRYLLVGDWKFDARSGILFKTWEALLVAEMKFAVTAMRTSAWCSVLGATLAMLLIQVYPPAYPRLQAMAAAILLALGFAAIVYVVLRLEKDGLLGRMFTDDKDNLTFGHALSALWPKMLALASILLTTFLPGVWDWVGNLVKTINSLH